MLIASCDKTDDAQEDVTVPMSIYLGKLLVCKVEKKNAKIDSMIPCFRVSRQRRKSW